jgi:hypothetical protein
MAGVFTFFQNKLRPVDLEKVTDEWEDPKTKSWIRRPEQELGFGIQKAIMPEFNGISPEKYAIVENPLGIYAGGIAYDQKPMLFSSKVLVDNFNKLKSKYDNETIFVIGEGTKDYSYYYNPVFPVIPLRPVQFQKKGEYQTIDKLIFTYDNKKRKVIYESPMDGQSAPLLVSISDEQVEITDIVEGKCKKIVISFSVRNANAPSVLVENNEAYFSAMLPHIKGGLEIAPEDLTLLENPIMMSRYANEKMATLHEPSKISEEEAKLHDNIRKLIWLGTIGLNKKERLSLDKIVRVTGEWRGDSLYSMFPVAMFGYKPNGQLSFA